MTTQRDRWIQVQAILDGVGLSVSLSEELQDGVLAISYEDAVAAIKELVDGAIQAFGSIQTLEQGR